MKLLRQGLSNLGFHFLVDQKHESGILLTIKEPTNSNYNFQDMHDNLYEKFNSHGFRSPEFSQIKADDHYRIIITGSSIVYGRTSNQYTISKLLENKLNELYGKTKTIEVINAGVPGYNSFHILRQFDTKLKYF